jgi:hypothetical protein
MKYTAEQVLAVLVDAAAPLPTADVSLACRLRFGAPDGTVGRVSWGEPREVRDALNELAEAGKVVSAKRGEDGSNAHLAYVPTEKTARYWATVELADRWRKVLDARAAAFTAAYRDGELLPAVWAAAGGPRGLRARVEQDPRTGLIDVRITGSDEHLAYLSMLLREATAHALAE